jgi:stalled ribosome alternative rescue factor ArfA
MAVTSSGKDRAKSKTQAKRRMKRKKTVKRRNAPAAALADPRFRKRVVKSSKGYSRKGKAQQTEDETRK